MPKTLEILAETPWIEISKRYTKAIQALRDLGHFLRTQEQRDDCDEIFKMIGKLDRLPSVCVARGVLIAASQAKLYQKKGNRDAQESDREP